MQNVAPEPSAPDSEPALDRYLIGGRDASRVAECARCLVQIASPGMHKFWIASPSEVHHQGYRVPALRGGGGNRSGLILGHVELHRAGLQFRLAGAMPWWSRLLLPRSR